MITNEEKNKTGIFPIIPYQKKKRKSVQLSIEQLTSLVDNNSIKTKIKTVEGNKFKNIPKNNKLTNHSFVQMNKELGPARDKNYYLNLMDNANKNETEIENAYIMKKMDDMYKKNKSEKRRERGKMKTIKERSEIISVLKKNTKMKRKRKTSFNKDDYVSKNSISKKKKKKHSSNNILNFQENKENKSVNKNKTKEIENIRHIINAEEKVKKLYLLPKKEFIEENEEKINESVKMSNSNINNNINNNNKENKDDENNKKNKNNKKENKKEITNINNNININYIETKNNYEVKPEDKNENKKNKKNKKFFCFCCLSKKDDSSDFD